MSLRLATTLAQPCIDAMRRCLGLWPMRLRASHHVRVRLCVLLGAVSVCLRGRTCVCACRSIGRARDSRLRLPPARGAMPSGYAGCGVCGLDAQGIKQVAAWDAVFCDVADGRASQRAPQAQYVDPRCLCRAAAVVSKCLCRLLCRPVGAPTCGQEKAAPLTSSCFGAVPPGLDSGTKIGFAVSL